MSFCVLQMSLQICTLPTWKYEVPHEFLCVSDVPPEPQSDQDQPGYTWILMSFYKLQMSLKNHNNRSNMDTLHMDPHEFTCASGFLEKPQCGQDQHGYMRFLISLCVLQVSLKSHNLDRTNLDIDFESFWGTVALSVKAEFIQVQRIYIYFCKDSLDVPTWYSVQCGRVLKLQFHRRTRIVNLKKYVVFYCREYECMLDYK